MSALMATTLATTYPTNHCAALPARLPHSLAPQAATALVSSSKEVA